LERVLLMVLETKEGGIWDLQAKGPNPLNDKSDEFMIYPPNCG